MDKRAEFLRVADEVAKDREPNPWTAEPWPNWFRKVALRMARVFIPNLKRSDFELNRERFEGQGLAFVSQLVEEARKVDITKFPDAPLFDVLKHELESMRTFEADCVQATLHAASALPGEQAGEFFEAYAEGLKKRTAEFAIKRLGDSQTAQICLFLMGARPWIEKRRVANVTELFKNFMQIKEACPGQKEFFAGNAKARASWEQHFRRICSEDGVKLASRGHPKAKRVNRTRKAKAR